MKRGDESCKKICHERGVLYTGRSATLIRERVACRDSITPHIPFTQNPRAAQELVRLQFHGSMAVLFCCYSRRLIYRRALTSQVHPSELGQIV